MSCARLRHAAILSCHVQAYQNGIRRCMASVPLWRSSAYLEEKAGAIGKARAVLEQARLKNPKQDQLWLAAIRTELRSSNNKAADALMAKALQVSMNAAQFPVYFETLHSPQYI